MSCFWVPSTRAPKESAETSTDVLQSYPAMKLAFVIGVLGMAAALLSCPATADVSELRVTHRYALWRAWPQNCFLMPDVVVATDALGPYCSSPRARYYRRGVRRW